MANYKRTPLAERFWPKVDKSGDCWLWRAARNENGYGVFFSEYGRKAHRVSYILTYGPIPEGLNVLHRCDNPACVRPDHLFLGTQLDNMRDCKSKGRLGDTGVRGEAHGCAKLCVEDVRDIRSFLSLGWTQREIAKAFGVSEPLIGRIARGELWKHSA